MEGQPTLEFQDIRPEDMRRIDLNPHIEAYWNYGFPVIIGGHAKQYKDNLILTLCYIDEHCYKYGNMVHIRI